MIGVVRSIFYFFTANPFGSGILIGLIGSFIFWLILARIRPRIKFGTYISKRRAKKDETLSGVKYLFQFWNAGWRDITELEISVRLFVRGIDANYPQNFKAYSVPTGYSTMPIVKKWPVKEKILAFLARVTTLNQFKQQGKLRAEPLKHQTYLIPYEIQELQNSRYLAYLYRELQKNPIVKQELEQKDITASKLEKDCSLLEHLLLLGDGKGVSYLEINISGYDRLSGTKRFFTRTYHYTDIHTKDFYGKDLKL